MEKIYYELRDRLARTPQGFPSTGTGLELKILKKLFNPEQAELFVKLADNRTLFQMAVRPDNKKLQKKLKMTEEALDKKLKEMSSEGLLLRQRLNDNPDTPEYFLPGYIVGLYEYSGKKMDKELAQLCMEYISYIAEWMNAVPTKQLRAIPVEKTINTEKTVLPYNKLSEVLKGHTRYAISPCVCAKEHSVLGKKCKGPMERCISFDWYADHWIDSGLGREASLEEVNDLLIEAEKKGLMMFPSNTFPIIGMCLCCDCCCSALKIINYEKAPARNIQSAYAAKIDPEKCEGCGTCVDRCNIAAIKNNNDIYEIDLDRCLGCGLCVSTCPNDAIEMFNNGKTYEVTKGSIPMCLNIYEEQIKVGNLPKKDLPKVKLTKFLLKLFS